MVLIPFHLRRISNNLDDKLSNIGVSRGEMDWECNPLLSPEDPLLLECIDLTKK
jgi:hypothetical protein